MMLLSALGPKYALPDTRIVPIRLRESIPWLDRIAARVAELLMNPADAATSIPPILAAVAAQTDGLPQRVEQRLRRIAAKHGLSE